MINNLHVQVIYEELKKILDTNTIHKIVKPILYPKTEHFPTGIDRIGLLPNSAGTILNYCFHSRLAEVVGILHYKTGRFGDVSHSNTERGHNEPGLFQHFYAEPPSLVIDLCLTDLHRVNCFVAAYAWLTTNDFRWHHKYKHLPEDLSYGLILQYPDFIIPYAACISGLMTEEYKKNLGPDILKYIKKRAYQDMHKCYTEAKGYKYIEYKVLKVVQGS